MGKKIFFSCADVEKVINILGIVFIYSYGDYFYILDIDNVSKDDHERSGDGISCPRAHGIV